ncbi:XRE family transcriptional regulator [Streptomyces fructofermentans]|uniref:Uncharacterized protein n=1 Tax=Streptomyces fructofermentans TaxID=152141 RepID=A0A918U6K5_9ACTN|nr:XRE family transcriptional regulator [Streptomyces fructofermentans]GGY00083.1 hypothetical protein GCM10010515_77540 [Streptomyces fructofermentans]
MAEQGARTDLADLVRERRRELGSVDRPLSLRALAARCIDPEHPEAGPVVDHNWIDRLEKGTLRDIPDLTKLQGLRAGLDVPWPRVQAAAGSQFFAIDPVWSEDRKTRALVPGYREMSPEDQAKADDLTQSWRDAKLD